MSTTLVGALLSLGSVFAVAGIVTPKFRTARIAATETEVFLASEAAGKVKLYRMEYPDFSQAAVAVRGRLEVLEAPAKSA